MSNYGLVSTVAYAAAVFWVFWRLWTLLRLAGFQSAVPPLLLFMVCALAARRFADVIHRRFS